MPGGDGGGGSGDGGVKQETNGVVPVVRAGMFGQIEHFVVGENFEEYISRLEMFFLVNDMPDDKKVPVLVTVAGPSLYTVAARLCAPEDPRTKSYADLVHLLKEHLDPTTNVVAERYKFRKCEQHASQSITEFIISLKATAQPCKFDAFLSDSLRDQFVAGIRDQSLRKKLLTEPDLTFDKACSLARSWEAALSQNKEMSSQLPQKLGALRKEVNQQHQQSKTKRSNQVKEESKPSRTSQKSTKPCFRCNRHHDPNTCPARSWTCYSCGKMGHVSTCCRSKSTQSRKPGGSNRVAEMSEAVEVLRLNMLGGPMESVEQESVKSQPVEQQTKHPSLSILEEASGLSSGSLNKVDSPEFVSLDCDGHRMEFEADCGACRSVISIDTYQKYFAKSKLNSTALEFVSVSGQRIKPLGTIDVRVSAPSGIQGKLELVVIRTDRAVNPLLGRDGLDMVFPDWRRIFSVKSVGKLEPSFESELKTRFPNVISESANDVITGFTAEIILKPDTAPVFHKAYSVPFLLREKLENSLEKLVQDGILVPVRYSSWANPIVVVPKKDGSVRICLDGKAALNRHTTVEHYPLPRIDDILAKLANWRVFCKIDLSGAYLQVALSESSQSLCTINTHRGLFRYTRMPFGITSAPAIFQSIIDQILIDSPGIAYLDDIVVGGASHDECRQNLFMVLQKLNDHNVRINFSKSCFFKSEIEYLGHTITSDGIRPSEVKVRAIVDAPSPENVNQLQAYLGLLNYYHRFLPNLSMELRPLYSLLQKNCRFLWSSQCQAAFEKTKKLLVDNNLLEPYDPSKPIILAVDASPYGVGAVLSHLVDQVEKPICFASSTLTPAQKNYAQVHKEALAVIFGITKFHKYVYGSTFKLVTDNTGIKEIFNPTKGTSAIAAARLQRWALILAGYNYTIEHRPGKFMNHADALSRLPLPGLADVEHVGLGINNLSSNGSEVVNIDVVRNHQKSDPILSRVLEFVSRGWPKNVDLSVKSYCQVSCHLGIDEGVLYFDDRVVVPDSLKSIIVEQLHSNHDGIVRMKMLGRSYVWWKNFDKDVAEYVRNCKVCQQRQAVPKEVVESKWPKCERPFQRIHMDLFYFEGSTLLIVVDGYSKFIDVRLMKGSNSLQMIEQVESIFAYFGIAEEVVTDNGPPFNSELFVRFLEANSVKVSKSPPYHPQSNGLAERGVRTVKDVFKKYLLDEKHQSLSISRKINRFLINYRNTPSTVTSHTPSSMLFSYTPRTLTNMINPRKVEIESKHSKPVVRVEDQIEQTPPEVKKSFNVGDKILYRNHFKELIRWVPAIVLQKLSPLTYLISVEGNVRMVHVNQIRYSDLADKFHPSMPVVQPAISNRVDQGSEDNNQAVAPSGGSNQNEPLPAKDDSQKKAGKKKKSTKRRRSESKSPKVRRSNRLKGQPRMKYSK